MNTSIDERVNALYDEIFCTGKHLLDKVPICPKAIIRRHLEAADAVREREASQTKGLDEPAAFVWFHRGLVNFDTEDSLSELDDGKGTPIPLYTHPAPQGPSAGNEETS